MLEGMEMFGKYAVFVLWAAANLFFFIYDYALTQLTDMYINWFRKKYSEENDGDVFMNEEQEKEILNEAKIQTARHKKKNTDNKPCCNNSGHSNGYSGVYTSYKKHFTARQALQPWSVSLITTVALLECFIFTFIQALQVVIAVIPPIQVVGGVLFGWFWGGCYHS